VNCAEAKTEMNLMSKMSAPSGHPTEHQVGHSLPIGL